MTTLSDKIRECKAGVILNPYQGNDRRVLFVCTMGILRSATGARMYAHKYNTRAAGTSSEALIPLTDTLVEWANQIVFVNKENYNHVVTTLAHDDRLAEIQEKSVVLNIPDTYEHGHPEIIKAFNEQYENIKELNDQCSRTETGCV